MTHVFTYYKKTGQHTYEYARAYRVGDRYQIHLKSGFWFDSFSLDLGKDWDNL